MENFFYEDNFYSELSDLLEELEIEESEIASLPDDWQKVVMCTKHEKIIELTAEFVTDAIIDRVETRYEERFPEDSDSTWEQIRKAIRNSVNVEKMNELMPSLYYPADEEFTITKLYLIDNI